MTAEKIPQITQIKHKLKNTAKEHKMDELRYRFGGGGKKSGDDPRHVTQTATSGSSPIVGEPQSAAGGPTPVVHPEVVLPRQTGEKRRERMMISDI